jgi:hypothetical protein
MPIKKVLDINKILAAIKADILPDVADTYSLGSADREWLNLYIGDSGKIYFGLAQGASLRSKYITVPEVTRDLFSDAAIETAKYLIVRQPTLAGNVMLFYVGNESNPRAIYDHNAVWYGAGGDSGVDVTLGRSAADVLRTPDAFDANSFKVAGVDGVDGTFTTVDGKTVTVTKGIITSIV